MVYVQWIRDSPQGALSKPILLALITALVVAVAIPLILPHVNHPSMISHVIVHIASITIAVFLSVISYLAYARNRSSRLLFMTLGFIVLAVVEGFYLLDASETLPMFEIPATEIELSHVILLIMLAMFGLGVLKVNK